MRNNNNYYTVIMNNSWQVDGIHISARMFNQSYI